MKNFPGLSALGCNETSFSLGIDSGGQVIANGGFLSVGPLSGSAFPIWWVN